MRKKNEGQPVRSRDGPQAARTVISITARTASDRHGRHGRRADGHDLTAEAKHQ